MESRILGGKQQVMTGPECEGVSVPVVTEISDPIQSPE